MGYSQGSFSNITLEHVTFIDMKRFFAARTCKKLQPVYKLVHFHDSEKVQYQFVSITAFKENIQTSFKQKSKNIILFHYI